MGKRDSGPGVVQIDERFLMEWFQRGYESLVEYLTKHAKLDDWCLENHREAE